MSTDFASAAAASTRDAMRRLRRPDREMEELARKKMNVDARGTRLRGILVGRLNKSGLSLSTVVFPRPAGAEGPSVGVGTFERADSTAPTAKYFWRPPKTEGAEYPVFWWHAYMVKETPMNPIDRRLQPGDVVDVVGLRYERTWCRADDKYSFALTAGEVVAVRDVGAWDLADPDLDVRELLRPGPELAREAEDAHKRAYEAIMGEADARHEAEALENPNSVYLVARRYFVLPIDQSFLEGEEAAVARAEPRTAVVFDAALDGERSYEGTVGKDSVMQRMLRMPNDVEGKTLSGPVSFILKQNAFGGGALESRMVMLRMLVFGENLCVVPTRAEWVAQGPVLARGMRGAMVVMPEALVDTGGPQPHVAVHGRVVWDLRRTVEAVGVPVPVEDAMRLAGVNPETKDVVGRALDVPPAPVKDPAKDKPGTVSHFRPFMDCVNLSFVTGNVARMVEAAESGDVAFVAVAGHLKLDLDAPLAQLEAIRALDMPDRLAKYLELSQAKALGKKQSVAVFACGRNVRDLIDAETE